MSLHSTYFGGVGLPLLLATQGEAVTYTEPGGEGQSITALVGDKRTVRQESRGQGSSYEHERTVTITKDPSGPYGGIAAIVKNARITYAGEAYAVMGIESESIDHYQLKIGFVGQADLAAAGTRVKR